ncbi:hypothetical protein BJ170DRAFT_678711 [Xylariales sp. AK1849]|nr:hypothetical protein BJ170DRAFT_678711 [Xylariales sp. AK1849]
MASSEDVERIPSGQKIDPEVNFSAISDEPQRMLARRRLEDRQSFQVSDAYVSGMKEALTVSGKDLCLLTTFRNIGYIIGHTPSQCRSVSPWFWQIHKLVEAWNMTPPKLGFPKNAEDKLRYAVENHIMSLIHIEM